ncbi:MAG: TolC family protein [Oligoflexia bacterium]|nr:TolC family protein [Oligoflexia bacterium]
MIIISKNLLWRFIVSIFFLSSLITASLDANETVITPITLATLLKNTLDKNSNLKSARLLEKIADDRKVITKAALLPTIGFYASQGWEHYPPENEYNNNRNLPSSIGINASIPIFNKALHQNYQREEVNKNISTLEVQRERQAAVAEISSVYIELLSAYEQESVNKKSLKSMEGYLEAFNKRFHLGDATKTDIKNLESKFSIIRSKWLTSLALIEEKRSLFLTITLSEPPTGSRAMRLPQIKNEALKISTRDNLEVKILQERIHADEITVATQRAGHWPKLNLQGTLSRSWYETFHQVNNNRNDISVEIRLEFPIFNGYAVSAGVNESIKRKMITNVALEYVGRDNTNKEKRLLQQLQLLSTSKKELERAVTHAQMARSGILTQFQSGTRTTLDILNAQDILFEAESALIQNRYQLLKTQLEYLQIIGRLSADAFVEEGV